MRETTDPRRWPVRLSPGAVAATIPGTIMTTLRPPSPPRPDLHLDLRGDVEVRETHISWVFLTRDRAYKVKKPIQLPYLDYLTPARRLAMCRAEVELNRRLAPAIYVGVRGLVPRREGGLALASAEDPEAVEFAVEMRRFDEADTLDARLRAGAAGADELARLGRKLADFHDRAPVEPAEDGAERVKRALDDTFATLRGQLGPDARRFVAARERMAGGILAAAWDELDRRATGGRIREGHGDLRLEHVILGDLGPAVVDCVEFDRGLRSIDVAGDLAFLVMDLHRLGRGDLAPVLVAAYREAGGDPGSDALLALLAAYRAYVRAKVALTRTAQHGPAGREDANQLLDLAARLLWHALTPLTLVVAGVAATGKSTLAASLAAESGFGLVSTDVLRKRLAGLEPTARAPRSLYDDEHDRETYAALGREAAAGAAHGVVVDGTFRRAVDRNAFFAVRDEDAPLVLVECRAPASVLLARAEARSRAPSRVSDADTAVVARQLAAFEPVDELDAPDHVLLRSDRPVADLVSEVGEALARRAGASPAR
jgi:aminoglycoside phosphotransferase family enzyme/predicted kinase